MTQNRLLAIPLVALMVAFGVGVYFLWGALAHKAGTLGGERQPPQSSQFTLPGTVIVAQDGNLYQLQGSAFQLLANGNAPEGSGEGWQQPAVTPDHQHIIAVKRGYNYSDLYELSMSGQVEKQLTNNASTQVDLNQWAFFPAVSHDGSTVFYTYDQKEEPGNYQIDFSIYSLPLAGGQPTAWTNPYGYGCGGDDTQGPVGPASDCGSGGSLQAVPLASGGIIFSYGYVNTDTQQTVDQIAYLSGPLQTPTMLTPSSESCYSPAVSPDGTRIAFICSPAAGGAITSLEVATLSGGAIGAPQVVATGSMIASPTWSPDGQSLLYFNATGAHQLFQIELLAVPTAQATPAPTATPTPKRGTKAKPTPTPTATPVPTPQPLTTNNDFLATSSAVWISS
jgi:Tol biopolymer transport system component